MNPKRRIGIAAVLVVAVAVVLWLTLLRPSSEQVFTISGTVEATEADLGFQRPGRIDSVAVQEGDTVIAGAELAWLDRTEVSARKRSAEAQERAAQARLSELERGFRTEEVTQGRSALRAASRRLEEVERDLDRVRRLHTGGAVSQRQLDQAETTFELASAEQETAQDRLEILESGPREEQIAAQRAILAQASAAVAQVEATLANSVVRAPVSGVITVRHREPGEIVPAGTPVVTLRNQNDRWVRIFVREDRVGRLAVGHLATITADAYPDQVYGAEISFIAGEAEFTPRNVQTTAERVKLVYRVKVRITDDPSHDLKPGLPADVHLELDERQST